MKYQNCTKLTYKESQQIHLKSNFKYQGFLNVDHLPYKGYI